MVNVGGTQATGRDAITGQVGLSYKRMSAQLASQQPSSTVSALVPASRFLPRFLSMIDGQLSDEVSPFFTKFFFPMAFVIATDGKPEHPVVGELNWVPHTSSARTLHLSGPVSSGFMPTKIYTYVFSSTSTKFTHL